MELGSLINRPRYFKLQPRGAALGLSGASRDRPVRPTQFKLAQTRFALAKEAPRQSTLVRLSTVRYDGISSTRFPSIQISRWSLRLSIRTGGEWVVG